MSSRRRPYPAPARQQQGAALYVALIMLVLLALIGVVGMQVATLQERMAANYLAANMAFQRAEQIARQAENLVVGGGATTFEDCSVGFEPQAWVDARGAGVAQDSRVVNISVCTGKCSSGFGLELSDDTCKDQYRITAFARDRANAAESSSLAAIDTIFIRP